MIQTVLSIILRILAVFGIGLLCITGLLLAVVLLAFFVPLRYSGNFAKDSSSMRFSIKASWLLRLIRIKAVYEKELVIRAFILFFKVYDSGKPKKEKKKKRKRKEERPARQESAKAEPADITEPAVPEPIPETVSEPQEPDGTDESGETSGKISVSERIREFIQNCICKIKNIYDKIRDILQNIRYYVELIREEETAALFRTCKARLWKILRSVLPRKLRADLVIGTGSPDTTGYCMALAGILYPHLGRFVNIEPDFEKTIFEGQIYFKGQITSFVILLQAVKFYFDKDLRKFIRKLKREES